MKRTVLEELEGGEVVVLDGAIDSTTVNALHDLVNGVVADGRRWFLLDMQRVKYINSTGLGSLVKYADIFRGRQGAMVLIGVQPKVKVIIRTLGLNEFFAMRESLEQAVRGAQEGTLAEEGSAARPAAAPAPRPDMNSARRNRIPTGRIDPQACAPSMAPSPPSKPSAPAAPSGAPASDELLQEVRKTNRLLMLVVRELRSLRDVFEEEEEDDE
jgi:anti-sigma B factor antagonist